MAQIRVLPKEVSELIAAGEVIERPASIVKELIENSIDAKATAITVEIQNGGIRFIRISDNGCGIASSDAPTAFLRHATSKVKVKNDLDNIGTLGFRGEALASVAAVAKVELMTKTKDEELGTYLRISASEIDEVRETGCPEGTTITVRDIFYNIPARLKFLKKDVTEANAVASIVEKIALSHPEISIKFIRDNKVIFITPGDGELLGAIYTVFGRDFANGMMPVNYEFNGIKVTGYTGKPMFHRANRSMQHFFINGRYTKSRTCGVALEEGYKGAMMVGKFPACVLELEMPFDRVDVNVHPAKIEVRFVDEHAVFDAVYFAVKSAIAKDNEIVKPVPEVKEEKPNTPPDIATPFSNKWVSAVQESIPINAKPKPAFDYKSFAVSHKDVKDARTVFEFHSPAEETPVITEKEPEIPKEENVSFTVIGEIFFTYILVQTDDEFIIIDKHAAHERILYNKLKNNFKELDKQLLLSPVTVSLSRQECELVMKEDELLSQLGFTVEDFGSNTVLIREIPAVSGKADAKEMFMDIVSGLLQNKKANLPEKVEDILHRIACRSAVKGHDKNNIAELCDLVNTVFSDENVRYCPHGRPVMIRYTKKEIEKLFGRIV